MLPLDQIGAGTIVARPVSLAPFVSEVGESILFFRVTKAKCITDVA